ncbi:hypothetical protein PV327_005417 [Microctonus hyperodae]|uniref:Uncharacterized protein n=1 Tax=Microctonus hyperodae TaxID=165561 RepID=A0AA39G228_MICHY|nr:hypothetical protein PV327_005417 [Microctonus hyperodae]
MELPGKISDVKIHTQNPKSLPNGLNKDVITSKGLPATNGLIKHSFGSPTLENAPLFDKTVSMNHANNTMSEEKYNEIQIAQDFSTDCNIKKSPLEDVEEEPKPTFENHINNDKSLSESPSSHQESSTPINHINEKEKETEDITSPQKHSIIAINNNPLPGPITPGQTAPGLSPGSSIPKPMALVKGTTKPPKEITLPAIPSAAKLKGDILHRKLDPNTVAMVSPMPSISDLMSDSSHSNSNSTGQSNSSDSSVIYRPSSESGSEIKTIPNRKIDTTFEQIEKVLDSCNGTVPDEETEMTVKPMQPLLRGYTPGARCLQTLPNRTTGRQYTILHSSSHHHVAQDYSDIDIASGYLSDGEILKGGMNIGSRALSDLCDGYMSEGGASLYSRRINPSYGHDHESLSDTVCRITDEIEFIMGFIESETALRAFKDEQDEMRSF